MKVLIIRFSSIGDIVLTSPVIRCVKEQLEGVELHYLTKQNFKFTVEHHPYIDKIHLFDNSLKDTLKELQSENFDLILDLHKSLRSRYFTNQLSTKSISFNKLNYKKWLFTKLKLNRLPEKHLVDRYFDRLRKINVQNDNKGLQYFYGEISSLDSKLNDYTKVPYTIIAIGGTYTTKKLPISKLVEIVDKINSRVILIGGKEDRESASVILSKTTHKDCIDLCGEINVHASAYLIERSQHVITHDTGMMHIAAAFQKPLSVVWGNTHPSFGMYPYGYKDQSKVFQHEIQLDCRPCSKLGYPECPKGHFNCMNLQNVEEIVKNCNSVELEQ